MTDRRSEPLKTMFPEELEEYMRSHGEESFTLLDVRQPSEYEEAHLPGARLVPLPLLADSLSKLETGKTTIVYCAVGGRSRVAAQFLVNHGYVDVYHLQGGIQAWEQPTATGPVELHLRFVRGDESPREVIGIAYEMEEGLRQFHLHVKEATRDPELAELLTHLVKAEESHKRALVELLEKTTGMALSPDELREGLGGTAKEDVMEGGIDIRSFMEQNREYLKTVAGYIDIAMMIEIQALDLYLRMANECGEPKTQEVLRKIGGEEKIHLAMLGKYMDQKSRSSLDRPIHNEGYTG